MITPLPGRHADQAGLGHAAVLRRRARRRGHATASRCRPDAGRLPRHPQAVARRCCARVYGDPERYVEQYWSEIPGIYFTGDGARRDEDGYFWIMGRVDDVINVAGHRLGTMEVESALVSHPRGRRGGRRRPARRAQGPGDRRLRHARRRAQTADDALREGAEGARRQGDRRPRAARRHPLHRRAAQDPQRQDHAPPAARHRRRARRRSATPRRSRTTRCSRSCARKRNSWTRSASSPRVPSRTWGRGSTAWAPPSRARATP